MSRDMERAARDAFGTEPEPFEARPTRFRTVAACLAAVALVLAIVLMGGR